MTNFKWRALLAFCSFFATQLFANDTAIKHVVLYGIVDAPEQAQIQLLMYSDPVGREQIPINKVLHPDNHSFIFDIEIDEPTTCFLQYDGQTARLYLEPSDTIFVHFSGENMFRSIQFYGKGAVHNNYLAEIERAFDLWGDNIVQYQMSVRNPDDFRHFVDDLYNRKTNWAAQYIKKNGGASAAFLRYAYNDLTYWRAYNLLMYPRIRSISQGVAEVIKDRPKYYSFFAEMLVSNPEALNNNTYWRFLDLYNDLANAWMRDDVPPPVKPNAIAIPQTDALFLYETPDASNPNVYIQPGPLPYTGQSKTVNEKLLYQLISPDGRLQWCNAEQVVLEQPSLNTSSFSKVKVQVENTVQKTYAYSVWPEMHLKKSPDGQNTVTVKQGEKLEYLNQRTSEHFPYAQNGQELYDQYILVRTPKDSIGWAFNGGIVTNTVYEVETVIREEIDPSTTTAFNNYDRLFSGRVLSYMLARDFFKQSPVYPLDVVKEKADLYKELNDYPPYNEFVEYVYQMVLRAHTEQRFVSVAAPVKYRSFDKALGQYMLADAKEAMRLADEREKNTRKENATNPQSEIIPTEPQFSMVGKAAPEFNISDATGQPVMLRDYLGKVVILDFWATWCQPCRAQMDNQREWASKLADRGVIILYVSLDNDESKWKNVLKDKTYPGLHARDAWRETAAAYALEAMPTTYVINKSGNVVAHHMGALSIEEFEALIALAQ